MPHHWTADPTGERPYKCLVDGCIAAFVQSNQLVVHNRSRHTGERPYKCLVDGCGAAFFECSQLIIHTRCHTGERPYKCLVDGCGAAFVRSGGLIAHNRIHTGEKPYKCIVDGCGAAFSNSSALTSHNRIHSGERPFKCTVDGCDAAFCRSAHLVSHNRMHTDERPYVCTVDGCDKTFAHSNGVRCHIEVWHTARGNQRQKKQEQRIANLLEGADMHFDREVRFDFSCFLSDGKFSRVDFVLQRLDQQMVILLEIDEHQHKYGNQYGTNCESARMIALLTALRGNASTKNACILALRYNPHEHKVRDSTRRTRKRDREALLLRLLLDPVAHVVTSGGRVIEPDSFFISYLFYDTSDGVIPDVVLDSNFAPSLRECVLPAVWI